MSDCWTTAAAGTPDAGVTGVFAEVPTVATGKLPVCVSAFPWETVACKACSGSTGIPTPRRFSLKKLAPRLQIRTPAAMNATKYTVHFKTTQA